jgi:hypothetical protein
VYEEEWSKMQNGRHILREVADFEEYSHGPKNIKGIEAKELETTMWSPYEGQSSKRQSWTLKLMNCGS